MKELLGSQETLEGTVKRITFQKADTGFTIANLAVEKNKQPVPIVGTMTGLTVGENIRVTGHWQRHEKFGLQFQVESLERILPVSLSGIEKFLASGGIPGIGPATAKKLVGRFGLQTFEVMEQHPERLTEIEGIGEVKAGKIAQSFQRHQSVKSVQMYLGARGVSPSLADKIYKKYGADALSVLEENPYRLVDEVVGVGFKTADKLAGLLGRPADSPERLRTGLKHLLRQSADEGHVYLPEQELLAKAEQLLGLARDPLLLQALQDLQAVRTGGVIAEDGFATQKGLGRSIYLAGFYFAEKKTAELLRKMIDPTLEPALFSTVEKPSQVVAEVEHEEGLSLAPLQRQAVEAVLVDRLVVLTGGPGTGKTTTVKAMIAALQKQGITPVLAAPTGRAAKRMTESTGVLAKTLHRLLEYGPVEGEGFQFVRNEENKLEGTVFIIDEASMIDLLLFYSLLRALPDGARLVLCGDIDQLPSVGAGRILQDLILSERATVVRLQTIFRQAQESMIVKNAHRINQGLLPFTEKQGDFFFIEEGDTDQLIALVLSLCAQRLPAFLQADPIENMQVLVPMRRGPLGVDAFNERLQAALNPMDEAKTELLQANRVLRVGDKVMQMRNNYQKEVFNGDVGRITAIDREEGDVTVTYLDQEEPRHITYASGELDEISLAYAVSVHKSQGSEYPCVILPLVTMHRVMLQRNLLYTGVTRAKRLAVVVGTKEALRIAVRSNNGQKRYSHLTDRIKSPESGLSIDHGGVL